MYTYNNNTCAHHHVLIIYLHTGLIFSDGHVRTARKTIHARPRHLGKIHARPRIDGVFDAVTITVYY